MKFKCTIIIFLKFIFFLTTCSNLFAQHHNNWVFNGLDTGVTVNFNHEPPIMQFNSARKVEGYNDQTSVISDACGKLTWYSADSLFNQKHQGLRSKLSLRGINHNVHLMPYPGSDSLYFFFIEFHLAEPFG